MQRIVAVLIIVIGTAVAACSNDEGAPPTSTGSTPLATVTVVPLFEQTPAVAVTGLFVEPRPLPETVSRSLGERPPSQFSEWDRESTMLYDVVAGTEVNLGPGLRGRFSPDSTRMVWIASETLAGGEAMFIDLRTMERRSLGPAFSVMFIDDDHVYISPPTEGMCVSLDLNTDTRTPRICSPPDRYELTPDGYRIVGGRTDEFGGGTFSILDDDQPLLTFDAYQVVPAGTGWLAVTTPLQLYGEPNEAGFRSGTTNVFLIEIATGDATFIATSQWDYANWPLAANDTDVAWTDGYCSLEQGPTKVYDRRSRTISDLGVSLWVIEFTDDGLLATDDFGPRSLIDLEALEYRVVLPGGQPQWSSDWRYASIGLVGGHGGFVSLS